MLQNSSLTNNCDIRLPIICMLTMRAAKISGKPWNAFWCRVKLRFSSFCLDMIPDKIKQERLHSLSTHHVLGGAPGNLSLGPMVNTTHKDDWEFTDCIQFASFIRIPGYFTGPNKLIANESLKSSLKKSWEKCFVS